MTENKTVVEASVPARRPRRPATGVFFRRVTMRRAIIEAIGIFVAGRLLAMVPVDFWPFFLYPLVLVLRLVLYFAPPVWAATRVLSTKREKMSRRFWKLGWQLALYCTLANAALSLAIGEPSLWGGATSRPDLLRFGAHGATALSPGSWLLGEVITLVVLAAYFTLAVVCTRLANGGFMRFTMPAGDGRVTL
jgi:hypothetical protein